MLFHKLLLPLVLILPVEPLAHSANLVQNGSLEDLNGQWVNTNANYMSLLAGATAIANWTVSAGTTNEIVWAKSPTSDNHNAADGVFFVDLTGFGSDSPNGAIQQTLANLIIGQSYAFSMDVEFVGSVPMVTVGGTTIAMTAGTPFTVGIDTWTPETGSFIAASTNPLLKIANQQAGQSVDFIDNISVTGPAAVPEPAALTLVISGAILGLARRMRSGRAASGRPTFRE
ncbi:MAG TPA: hypothetical protein VMH28_23425 [Candidatus Acidoferrales bacterium]|nr:hypothetical protein [Candidatus Acidoferrales bacterium]